MFYTDGHSVAYNKLLFGVLKTQWRERERDKQHKQLLEGTMSRTKKDIEALSLSLSEE